MAGTLPSGFRQKRPSFAVGFTLSFPHGRPICLDPPFGAVLDHSRAGDEGDPRYAPPSARPRAARCRAAHRRRTDRPRATRVRRTARDRARRRPGRGRPGHTQGRGQCRPGPAPGAEPAAEGNPRARRTRARARTTRRSRRSAGLHQQAQPVPEPGAERRPDPRRLDRRRGRQTGCSSAQNETSIAVNPYNPRNIVAGANDYRVFNTREDRNDATGWAYASLDGGRTWKNTLLPGLTFADRRHRRADRDGLGRRSGARVRTGQHRLLRQHRLQPGRAGRGGTAGQRDRLACPTTAA